MRRNPIIAAGILSFFALTLAVSPANATTWRCGTGQCYITLVKYYPAWDIVKAKLSIGSTETGCDYIQINLASSPDDGNYPARMIQLQLLQVAMITALSTGMKIAFESTANSGTCEITALEVRKP